MKKEGKAGGVRLLTKDDYDKTNAFGKPLVGWTSTSAGEGGLFNPRGFAMLRVVVQKLLDGSLGDLYDQPVIVENIGSIVVCLAGDKVGLVENYRMVGPRIIQDNADYVKQLNDEGRWGELVATLGEVKWEVPRGILLPDEKLEDVVVRTAKLEGLQEAGFGLEDVREIGLVNADSTFFPHPQHVVSGRIVSIGENHPEELEMIGKTKLFGRKEVRSMVDSGELDDGLTLSALAVAGWHF